MMARKISLFCIVMIVITMLAPTQITFSDSSNTNGSSQPSAASSKDVKERLKNAMVLFVGSTQAMVNNVEVQVDEGSADVKPIIKNNRTLVPVRFIAESLGAKVEWNKNSSTVKVSLGGKNVELVIGSANMKVGADNVALDAPAEVIGNRTFIPLRKLTEALGKKVFYDRGLIVISGKDNIFDASSEKGMIDNVIAKVNNLPVVGSYDKLKTLLSSFPQLNVYEEAMDVVTTQKATVNMERAAPSKAIAAGKSDDSADTGSADYSATNVQVQGVDEADVVKTDGQYIYQVNKNRIIVAKAYPAENMEIINTVVHPDTSFTPIEIYTDDKYLVVIGSSYEDMMKVQQGSGPAVDRYPSHNGRSTAKAVVYDIKDKTDIKKVREFELEGNYVSSRKIGSSLYMIANRYVGYTANENDSQVKPCYRDTAEKDDYINVDYKDIRYFPQMGGANYMLIGGMDLSNLEQEANVSTYLGAGQTIYASQQNLYVTAASYNNHTLKEARVGDLEALSSTSVYKFSLNNSQVTYIGKGEVPGSILNQFSMDEHNSYFRIATTTGAVWRNTSKNNIYILDELLNIAGRIENIAPGERIYSTRFMGDRGYMVTFKKVDPLFVLDLKDPQSPKILGKLKIPGYSDYLHPYDENHIIGFGKEAEEVGNWVNYQGMKIAVFDVTDVANPVEMFKESIGDRGTDSELLRNHKALLFSKDKNLLAFPVTVMEVKNKDYSDKKDAVRYGEFTFQGAYVYNIDLKKGFSLKGKITHLSDEDYLKSGNYGYSPDKYVQRILYIGDALYTLSEGMIKANNTSDLKERKAVVIP